MKRGRRSSHDQLTGGSKDTNPQTMSPFVVQTGNDATTSFQVQLPQIRLPIREGYSMVMEILWVDWYHTNIPNSSANNVVMGVLTTNPTTFASPTAAIQDPRVISAFQESVAFGGTAGTFAVRYPFEDQLTDEAGHGILVATDKMYLFAYSATTGVANELVARIGYRFKEVTLEEYIGIVQSQQ